MTATDTLADVLEQSRVRGAMLLRARLRSPWAVRCDPTDYAVFYVIERGACWLLPSGGRERVRLVRGDVVLLPHGSEHVIGDEPDRKPIAFTQVTRDCDLGADAVVEYGGDGPETVILAGAYRFEPDVPNPIMAQLPEIIHIEASAARASSGLQTALRLLSFETAERRSGYRAITDRLVDALFVYILREWLDAQREGVVGWLAALRDPRLGPAISRMHREFARPWTVRSLASEVGMSRAAFAREFTARTGEPPLAYLTHRRMDAAAQLLRASDETLAAIARRVGYESEYAFAKAFKRASGTAPGHYRALARAA